MVNIEESNKDKNKFANCSIIDLKNINIPKIQELVGLLNYYRNEYYNNSISYISDSEYDKLFDELKYLENKSGLILSNSPTQTVGYKVISKLNKTEHQYPMLSLDKTKSIKDIQKFIKTEKFIVMPKLDGLTIALTYDNGKLIKAETRGNGLIGEDVTHNIKTFQNVPINIPFNSHLVIFGEAIINLKNFSEINELLPDEEKFKTPRNLVSGSVRQLDPNICATRHVNFIAWRVVEGIDDPSFSERLNCINKLGFSVVPYVKAKDISLQDLEGNINTVKHLSEIYNLPIDGLVFSYDDINLLEKLGSTSHHLRGQYAFKFEDDTECTKLKEIEWSMGITGVLTPVAIFDPVYLGGTKVQRASLHNISILESLGVKKDSVLTIAKNNDIIPGVIEAQGGNENIKIPYVCPYCGQKLTLMTSEPNNVKTLICKNVFCPGRRLQKFIRFCSKDGFNINGLSEHTLSKLLEMGYVANIADIFELKKYKHELIAIDGFGKKKIYNILAAIENSKKITLDKFLYAMNIPMIGKTQSKLIAEQYNYDYYKLENAMKNITPENISLKEKNIYDWFQNINEVVLKVLVYIDFQTNINNSNLVIGNKLNGLCFAITGESKKFKTKKDVEAFICENGGNIVSSVSKKINYLIANEELNSNKYKKAKKLNIPIINDDQLMKMVRGDVF